MGEPKPARSAAIIGLVVTVILLLLAFMNAPIRRPSLLIPLILCLAYDGAAGLYQLKKDAIAASTEYRFQSNWKVAGLGLMWLAVTLALSGVIVLILSVVGIDIPE
jgi:hypothetical protein